MRYLKIASATNPNDDYIELNDLKGFLCTSFQTLGISRKLEFLAVNNRQFCVDNKPDFKKYSLSIEILTKYSEYEGKHRQLLNFLDRNKKGGIRLYYRPYDGMDTRYCLCDIESYKKVEKMQPVLLTLCQNSLWLGEEIVRSVAPSGETTGNVFAFTEDEDISDYYDVAFSEDGDISDYYCVSFYSGAEATAEINNTSYNDIPLKLRIYGVCTNPYVSLFRKGEETPIRVIQIFTTVDGNHYIEINASIENNGVWYVDKTTGERYDYSEFLNYNFGSPYIYIENGEYVITVEDAGGNICNCDIMFQEEFNE